MNKHKNDMPHSRKLAHQYRSTYAYSVGALNYQKRQLDTDTGTQFLSSDTVAYLGFGVSTTQKSIEVYAKANVSSILKRSGRLHEAKLKKLLLSENITTMKANFKLTTSQSYGVLKAVDESAMYRTLSKSSFILNGLYLGATVYEGYTDKSHHSFWDKLKGAVVNFAKATTDYVVGSVAGHGFGYALQSITSYLPRRYAMGFLFGELAIPYFVGSIAVDWYVSTHGVSGGWDDSASVRQ